MWDMFSHLTQDLTQNLQLARSAPHNENRRQPNGEIQHVHTVLHKHTHTTNPLQTIKQMMHLSSCADSSVSVRRRAEQLQFAC